MQHAIVLPMEKKKKKKQSHVWITDFSLISNSLESSLPTSLMIQLPGAYRWTCTVEEESFLHNGSKKFSTRGESKISLNSGRILV